MKTDSRLNQLLNLTLLVLWFALGLMLTLSYVIPFTQPVNDFMMLAGIIGIALLAISFLTRRKRRIAH